MNAPCSPNEREQPMTTPSALQRLQWLEDQFAQQLAAVETTDFRRGWQRHLDAVRAGIDAIKQLEAVTRERDEALYVPGSWICPQCGFVQGMLTMSAVDGSVWASDKPALPCPNDGEYMRRVTWRERAEDATTIALSDIQLLDDASKYLRELHVLLPDAELGFSAQVTQGRGVRVTAIGPDDSFIETDLRKALRAMLEAQR